MLRKRSNLVFGLLAAAALAWAIAPALSTARFTPAVVDFEQSLPQAQPVGSPAAVDAGAGAKKRRARSHSGEDAVRWRTPVIDAPRRFDFVGVAGTLSDLDFRARDEGGAWSEWVTVSDGNPLYTGGADQVQVRSHEAEIEGKLHYVNVSGDDTGAHKLLNGVRGAVNSAVITAIGTPLADASSPQPRIVSRKAWGADEDCAPRARPSYGKVKAAAIHHTVSSNTYSEAEAPAMVLGICRYHRNGNGWNDIGYNALVDRFGNVYEGRAGGLDQAVIGAQAEGINSYTTGVAVMGNKSTVAPSRQAKGALTKYLAWKFDIHGLRAKGSTRLRSGGGSTARASAGSRVRVKRIFGHGTTNFTECPGSLLAPQVRRIKRRVVKRMARYSDAPPPVVQPGEDSTTPGGTSPRRGKSKQKDGGKGQGGLGAE